MSFEKAKADLEEKGLGDHVIVLNESSATVAEAAHARGVEPASIAKTLSVLQGEKPVLSFNSALILLGALGILPPPPARCCITFPPLASACQHDRPVGAEVFPVKMVRRSVRRCSGVSK